MTATPDVTLREVTGPTLAEAVQAALAAGWVLRLRYAPRGRRCRGRCHPARSRRILPRH